MRKAELTRKTYETDIALSLCLDGTGKREIRTGIGFFDHMLSALAVHGGLDISLTCGGDLEVDMHHTVEDCGIALGSAFREALGERAGIRRFGSAFVPMDEALAFAAADISGRPFFVFENARVSGGRMEGFDPTRFTEFWRAFAYNAGITLHVTNHYGANAHHIAETCFKAVARALGAAIALDPRQEGAVPSTKGSLKG